MTVTSTASSGGGLPDFGVFQNQKVYTVYLDMRVSDEDTTPSWTLQYAVLQPPVDPANGGLSVHITGIPTPPYATLKQVPELSPESRGHLLPEDDCGFRNSDHRGEAGATFGQEESRSPSGCCCHRGAEQLDLSTRSDWWQPCRPQDP